MIDRRRLAPLLLLVAAVAPSHAAADAEPFRLEVLPPEHKRMVDPRTGAELLFLTTDRARDTNLYFHERSWLADGSMILFLSARAGGGAMAYVVETGELVRLSGPHGPISGVNAAATTRSIFGRRGDAVVQWSLAVKVSPDPRAAPSEVTAAERVIARLPGVQMHTPVQESCDGRHLAVGAIVGNGRAIFVIDVPSGAYRELCRIPDPPGYGGHVQWSHNNPNMLSFAGRTERLMVVDLRDGVPRNIYAQWDGELVTHEHWWVTDAHGDDQMVFCGGLHPKPSEESHVKVINVRTGVVRIIGAGAWWPTGGDEAIAKQNFWHCAGSEDGRWVAADNWHGDITLLEGKTTRRRILTVGHRHYGHGEHPHVGWDRKGRQVVFTSHLLGDPNVCVASIPPQWQTDGVPGGDRGRTRPDGEQTSRAP